MKAPPVPPHGKATVVIEHRVQTDEDQYAARAFHQENLYLGDGGASQVEVVVVTEHGAMHVVLGVNRRGQVFDQGSTRYMPHGHEPNEGLSFIEPKRIDTSPSVPGLEEPDGCNATIDRAKDRVTFRYALEHETDYPGDTDLPLTEIGLPTSSARRIVRWLAERLLGSGQ